MNKLVELFGKSTSTNQTWPKIVDDCYCPYLDRLCLKNRKSSPGVLIGSCTVSHGRGNMHVIICPHRLLERRQIFLDSLHLLTSHQPGNQLHIVPEISLPGGSVDYFVVSVSKGKVKDFVGIELQTVDTTGTVWPERQRFLESVGIRVSKKDVDCSNTFGMNWKMTAKTILMQLHHKVETFEHINRKLVLVLQDNLLRYMQKNYSFGHMAEPPRQGDSMHFHSYHLDHDKSGEWRLELTKRLSTDVVGVGHALGLQSGGSVELETIYTQLEARISKNTLFDFGPISDVTPKTEPS